MHITPEMSVNSWLFFCFAFWCMWGVTAAMALMLLYFFVMCTSITNMLLPLLLEQYLLCVLQSEKEGISQYALKNVVKVALNVWS